MRRRFYSDDAINKYAIDIIDIAEDAIICVDENVQIILFNRGAEKIFGYKSSSMLGQPLNKLLPQKYRQNHDNLLRNFCHSKINSKSMAQRMPVYALHKNGKKFPVEITISKKKPNERIILTAIIRDVSRIQGIQEKLEEANENLEIKIQQRTQKLEEANRQLQIEIKQKKELQCELQKEFKARLNIEKKRAESIQIVEKSSKLASIGVIAAGITHEINQPLNAIKVNIDSILYWEKRNNNVLPQRFIDKVQQIAEGTNRIHEIIQHMRSFWDSNARQDFKINVQQVIEKALSLASTQIYNHGIILEHSCPRKNIYIKGCAIRLEQIVINLVINAMHAVDFSNKNKKIEIIVKKKKNKVQIYVVDNGTGFPKNITNKNIFDPFYSTKNGGMGLGLAIVRYFVERLEGTIRFFNNKQGGATFCLEFPIWSVNTNENITG